MGQKSWDKLSREERVARMNEDTRREWRELGFHYERDDEAREWRLTGSRDGLLEFRDLLLAYAGNPRNDLDSEHEHYGPYSYLEVMTWPDPGLDNHSIHGSLADLARLASLIEAKVSAADAGDRIVIGDEFAAGCPYQIVLRVREDGFDPAMADNYLTA